MVAMKRKWAWKWTVYFHPGAWEISLVFVSPITIDFINGLLFYILILEMDISFAASLLPQRSWGKVMFFTRVCDSVHGGICLSESWDTTPPWEQAPLHDQAPPQSRHPPRSRPSQEQVLPRSRHPPRNKHPLGAGTPPGADPPAQCMEGDTVNKRAVCILLECNLVFSNLNIVISLSDRTHQRKKSVSRLLLLSLNEPLEFIYTEKKRTIFSLIFLAVQCKH